MSDHEPELRALRIIGTALFGAPALFLVIAIFLRSDPGGAFHETSDAAWVTWISLFAASALIATALLLPQPERAGIERIRGHFIVRLALVESGALQLT